MRFTLVDLFSFSISIAAIIGLIRYRKINPVYYPFLYCVWIAFLNEILGYFLIYSGRHNAINNNIYVLAEAMLFTWQFKNWGLFRRSGRLFIAILVSFVLFWIVVFIVIMFVSIGFTFAYPLIVDRKLQALDAVKWSFRAAMGNFGRLLLLYLLNAVLSIGGMLLCYVGMFLIFPITYGALAVAYEQVFGLSDGSEPGPHLPPPPPAF